MPVTPLKSNWLMDYKVKSGLLFLIICLPFWSDGVEEDAWVLSKQEEVEIEEQLKMLNKPYVKTFKDKNGEIYDCVDMYKQPAFDHPLLKKHTSRIRSSLQVRKANAASTKEMLLGFGFDEQCPSGTVLIRRNTKEDLVRAKKYSHYLHPAEDTEAVAYHAKATFNTGEEKYLGVEARMEVYHLKGILPNQITSAQIILSKGEEAPAHDMNTIQVGWHVAHPLYDNSDTHFFTYRTTDDYRTGCFNNKCGSFVQVSRKITPGMTLSNNVSEMTLFINRVDPNRDWQLMYQGSDGAEEIGFWPKEAFTNLPDISSVQMGGIVVTSTAAPSPPMGNGVLPKVGRGARFTDIALRTGYGRFLGPDESKVTIPRTDAVYWIGKNGYQDGQGYMFEYGGPGGRKW